jgi:hypothetical protein
MADETDGQFFAWLATNDPASLAEAMALDGSKWTDAHSAAAAARCRALGDHEPGDGTPEGEELAAIFRRRNERDTADFGDDDTD